MKSTDILRVENITHDADTFVIRWQMTRLCNYACDFCIQGSKETHIERAKGESARTREQICEHLISFMENQLNGRVKKIVLHLIGGEVTILGDFIPILKRLTDAKFQGEMQVKITTNLSMRAEVCEELRSIFLGRERRELFLSCSYYAQYADEDAFFEKVRILKKTARFQNAFSGRSFGLERFIRKNRTHVSIGYPLANDDDYARYKQFVERHSEYRRYIRHIIIQGYKTSISQRVKQELNRDKIEVSRIRVTLKNGDVAFFNSSRDISMILDEEPCFQPRNFLCDTGIRNISIDPHGNMSRCVSAVEETTFGNICESAPAFLTDSIRCPARQCGCTYYSRIDNDLY